MPFITEELYATIARRPKDTRLLTSAWPSYDEKLKNAAAVKEIEQVIKIISEIRSVRADMNVPAAAKIDLMIKDKGGKTLALAKANDEVIRQMARLTAIIECVNEEPKGAIKTVVNDATLIMPIADIIDLDKERERLRREIAKLEQDIRKVDQKFADAKFMDNAPQEIIEEHLQRKTTAQNTRDKLSTALRQLEAA
jgi:valyl-tRNA synthetase